MRTCVIFNPAARGEKARRFRQNLAEIAKRATLLSTTGAGDARKLAAEAVQQGYDAVVAAGGDGTLNEVLNGIGDSREGFKRVQLGVLPLGTINVFARELGIPSDIGKAWEIITAGFTREVDLPVARFAEDGDSRTRYFAQLAGAGFDARAIELTDWSLKKRVGPLAYVAAGLKGMSEKHGMVRIETDSGVFEGELILIGNGRLYGGSYAVFEEADLTDGMLDVAVFPKIEWQTLLRCGPNLLFGGRLPHGVARTLKTRTLRATCPERALFQLDGELAGALPADFNVEGRYLKVLAPK